MSIQHGIKASFLDGGIRSITLIGKDNYVACCCKIEAALEVADTSTHVLLYALFVIIVFRTSPTFL